jgi:aspartate kinase
MVFTALAVANCNVDTIIQNEPLGEGRGAEISFTIAAEDLRAAQQALDPVVRELGVARVDTDPEIGKVSIVGAGMRSHPGVAAKVFSTLAAKEINIEMISTSPIKISCVIRSGVVPDAVRALHDAFELGDGAIQHEPFNQEPR